ncbi:hypothetical protein V6N11_001979 [Hibiscus sabdariffa]|uniref:Uncharacterized protein n=1 Tax=Hibiscus sabdariffa TaxID=183260 RepID=A0ABR2QU16_9ROSI
MGSNGFLSFDVFRRDEIILLKGIQGKGPPKSVVSVRFRSVVGHGSGAFDPLCNSIVSVVEKFETCEYLQHFMCMDIQIGMMTNQFVKCHRLTQTPKAISITPPNLLNFCGNFRNKQCMQDIAS